MPEVQNEMPCDASLLAGEEVTPAQPTAHPLRCETCTHYGGHICYQQHNRMSNIELTLIEIVGCASHSVTRRQQPQPNTPRFVSNSVLVRCDKEDCIDFNKELCQPWKCDYWKSKQPDAFVQYESWISGMKYTDIKAAGTVAAIWIGNQRFLLDDEAERKRIIRQQQEAQQQ